VTVPPPGHHGGDGAAGAGGLGVVPAAILDLSASLNPAAPDPAPVVARHLGALGRYPDPTAATAALAAALDVDPDRLLLTNGGAEAIALLAAERPVGWVDEPDFSLYRRHLARVEPGAPQWRSDPHNPTGSLAGLDEQADVWDEAFYPLATGRWTSGRRGIVLGSLTKVFACPGLRLGYVLADDADLIRRLAGRQPRWAVNGLAAAALPDLLAGADLPAWAVEVARLRGALIDTLKRHGFEPVASRANYVLVPDAGGVRERLAQRGIVVRDCASFGLPDHVRIAVPTDAGLGRLDGAL
jgi:histidinol-phosphate/aromatic aminotransferase/cobyric acid decarboxylase-like protein